MVRRALRSRSLKRKQVKIPGGKSKVQYRGERVAYHKCVCGAKLNKKRLGASQIKKLTKTKKRPERPYPELCSKCMRNKFKEKVIG